MELFELTIEEKMDEVFAISLVENPAIESDFIYFGKEEIQFAKVDTEQRMLIGPVLIPDKKILRVDGEGKAYQVYLSKDTIKQVAQNYLMKKYTDKATLEHDKSIKGVHLVESWIKEGRLDKSNSYGLGGLPEGTWVGMFKITDDKLWNDYIKTGVVKGFSIEGLFSHKLIHASKSYLLKDVKDLTESEAKDLLNSIHLLLMPDIQLEGNPSIPNSSYAGEPAKGKKKFISPAMFAEGDVCPEATQNIAVNLKGRQTAIEVANYGPLNPNELNEDYWKAKADQFKGSIESAKKALCGNCSFFVQTKKILDCIAGGINDTNEWDTIKAGDLGYCEAFDFKCAANRTCGAWVGGGPIVD